MQHRRSQEVNRGVTVIAGSKTLQDLEMKQKNRVSKSLLLPNPVINDKAPPYSKKASPHGIKEDKSFLIPARVPSTNAQHQAQQPGSRTAFVTLLIRAPRLKIKCTFKNSLPLGPGNKGRKTTQANLNTTLLWRQEPEGLASAFSSVNGAKSTYL